jgi:hypothetical protein
MNTGDMDRLLSIMDSYPDGALDCYFPVENHRINWNGSEDLVVVAVPPGADDDMEKQLEGFDLNGGSLQLSKKETPTAHALVIAPNEYKGDYPKKLESPSKGSGPLTIDKTLAENKYFLLQRVRIQHDYDDGWFGGVMEIYFKISEEGGGWYEVGTWDVEADVELTINRTVAVSYYPNFTDWIKLEVWEDDDWGTLNDDFVADQYWDQQDYFHAQVYGPLRYYDNTIDHVANYPDQAYETLLIDGWMWGDIDWVAIRFYYYPY